MTTSFQNPAAIPQNKTLAQRLLMAERALMGLVLLGCGLSGLLSLLPGAPTVAAELSAALMKAGFAYPLLKGVEVLLELYMANAARGARAKGAAASEDGAGPASSDLHHPRAHRSIRDESHVHAPRYITSLAVH